MTMPSPERVKQAVDYCQEQLKFTPRILGHMAQGAPEAAEQFVDFYSAVWGDGTVSRKMKELIFVAIGVTHRSPACLIHVIPAIELGATDQEIFEVVAVATISTGFIPNTPGIPYAFQYALKVLEIAHKYRKGEPWEYVEPARFRM